MEFSSSLKENFEFRRLYSRGKSAAGRLLVVYARTRSNGRNRLGITVSAKLGCAVKRNRVRRRLREAYRLNERRFVRGLDMVIVVRGRGFEEPYRALEAELLALSERLGILI